MSFVECGQRVVAIEIEALTQLSEKIGVDFEKAADLIVACMGRLVVLGMGKSGIIGRKIAATMASTGTTSFFVHPAEAFHGDLGMIHADDVALMISNSGETEELVRLLPFMKYQGNKIIAMTGQLNSTLAKNANATLDISVPREACNNNLAPTCSTTVALVMGDALAIALSTFNNFQPEDFARFHPGGSLGRRLLTRVSDVMHKDNLPICQPDTSFRDVVSIITRGQLGIALVLSQGKMLGVITDGNLRKAFEEISEPLKLTAIELMTDHPYVISANENLAEAEKKMKELTKRMLVVVDEARKPVGVLQIFDVD
ncbi:MAG: KpsF/GutQ family sugar-phosphate isomerase [Sulfuritalea sp.]|nr:KpsF/GutQ family sugar-phosphate isomerase [Sulfuritalea sp.]